MDQHQNSSEMREIEHKRIVSMTNDLKKVRSRVDTLEQLYKLTKKELRQARIDAEEAHKLHTGSDSGSGSGSSDSTPKYTKNAENVYSSMSRSSLDHSNVHESTRRRKKRNSSKKRRESKGNYETNQMSSAFSHKREMPTRHKSVPSEIFCSRRGSLTELQLQNDTDGISRPSHLKRSLSLSEEIFLFHKKNMDTRDKLKDLCNRAQRLNLNDDQNHTHSTQSARQA